MGSNAVRKLLGYPIPDVFFGGARGGGKTDGMLEPLRFGKHYGKAPGNIKQQSYLDARSGSLVRGSVPAPEEGAVRSRSHIRVKLLGRAS